jgi:hypothetical protein
VELQRNETTTGAPDCHNSLSFRRCARFSTHQVNMTRFSPEGEHRLAQAEPQAISFTFLTANLTSRHFKGSNRQ